VWVQKLMETLLGGTCIMLMTHENYQVFSFQYTREELLYS